MSCTSASASVMSSFSSSAAGNGARDLRHFHGVGEAAAKVIGVAVGEDLRFAGQAAECPRMDHPCAVTLKGGAIGMGCFGMLPLRKQAPGVVWNRAAGRQGESFAGRASGRCHSTASGWRRSILPWPT